MQTTVELTEEAYRIVEARARERGVELGRVLSELVVESARERPLAVGEVRVIDGRPVSRSGRRITSADVYNLLTESERVPI